MTQLRAYIPAAHPLPQPPEPPHLRLTHATDSRRESVPNASPLAPPQQPAASVPQAASPKPHADSPQPEPSLEQLLSLYLDPQLTIADIAFTLGLSIVRTLQLVREQDFLDALHVYSHEHEKRANYLANCNIDTAARTFIRLTYSDKPETARKAAGAIVRMHAETKPQKVSPETQLKAAATLLKANPPLAPNPWNPDRKGGSSAKRTHKCTPSPERSAPSQKPRSGAQGEAIRGRGGSPGKTSTPQPF